MYLYDTVHTTVFQNDYTISLVFDSTYKPITLSQNEIRVTDSVLSACVNDYTSKLQNGLHNEGAIDINKKYYRQLVPAVNHRGEKVVWINCFCRVYDNKWRTDLIVSEDGGQCFFNTLINLSTKQCNKFLVNGNG
jgi:hypothetical protein